MDVIKTEYHKDMMLQKHNIIKKRYDIIKWSVIK